MHSSSNSIILPTAYLPPIEYFYYILNADTIQIEAFETYPKQTYRNRCRIYSSNGPLDLTIPVSKPNGNASKTNEIIIFNSDKWQINHWRTIESIYNASAFFLYYRDELEHFYTKKFEHLLEFNTEFLKLLLRFIGLKKEIQITRDYEKIQEGIIDLRNSISPKSKTINTIQPIYFQVFEDKHGFIPNLSIIDLLFMEGPNTHNYLQSVKLIS